MRFLLLPSGSGLSPECSFGIRRRGGGRGGNFTFSDEDNPDFCISGQSLLKQNSHNFRTNDDFDMKLAPVTKVDKENKKSPKNFDDEVMSLNCDAIVIFPIYGQFGAIQKPDSGSIFCKT